MKKEDNKENKLGCAVPMTVWITPFTRRQYRNKVCIQEINFVQASWTWQLTTHDLVAKQVP